MLTGLGKGASAYSKVRSPQQLMGLAVLSLWVGKRLKVDPKGPLRQSKVRFNLSVFSVDNGC